MALRRVIVQCGVRSSEFGVIRHAAIVVGVLVVMVWAPAAEAGVVRGIQSLLAGVLQIPLQTLAGTFNGPPVIGTAIGALNGVMRTAGMVTSGAVELASSGLGIAKSVAPFLLPFLF